MGISHNRLKIQRARKAKNIRTYEKRSREKTRFIFLPPLAQERRGDSILHVISSVADP